MPWTFSHLAAIIPIAKTKRLPFLGLAIGSFSPDTLYYLGQPALASEFHSLKGIFIYCFPVGLLLAVLFLLVRAQLVYLLPYKIREALNQTLTSSSSLMIKFLCMSCAIVIGALTHVVWDSFTHESGYMVNEYEPLRAVVFSAIGRDFKLFNLAQHISTVIGLLYIGLSYYKWINSEPKQLPKHLNFPEQYRKKVWLGIVFLSLIGSFGLTAMTFNPSHITNVKSAFLVQTIFNMTTLLLIITLLLAFVLYKRIPNHPK